LEFCNASAFDDLSDDFFFQGQLRRSISCRVSNKKNGVYLQSATNVTDLPFYIFFVNEACMPPGRKEAQN
jgi:hypothetical protein